MEGRHLAALALSRSSGLYLLGTAAKQTSLVYAVASRLPTDTNVWHDKEHMACAGQGSSQQPVCAASVRV